MQEKHANTEKKNNERKTQSATALNFLSKYSLELTSSTKKRDLKKKHSKKTVLHKARPFHL